MRDNIWLKEKLIEMHQSHFSDITDGNEIVVQFGRKSKTRLGSISLREKGKEKRRLLRHKVKELTYENSLSIITINGHLQNEEIPEKLVIGILAHEFCHFVHGFNSLREKRYHLPHSGGIINSELKERGLEDVLKFQKKWLKQNWKSVIK